MENFNENEKRLIERLRELKGIEPDFDFIRSFRVVFLENIRNSEKTADLPVWGKIIRFSFAFAGSLLLFLSLVGGVAWASQKSLPSDLLYPVKLATEKAKLAVAANDLKRAELRVRFAETRLSEIEAIHRNEISNPQISITTLQRFEKEMEATHETLDQLSKKTDKAKVLDLLFEIEDKLLANASLLNQSAQASTSEELKEAFLSAQTTTELGLERTSEKIFQMQLETDSSAEPQDSRQRERISRALQKLESRLTGLDASFTEILVEKNAALLHEPTLAPESILPPLSDKEKETLANLATAKNLAGQIAAASKGESSYLEAVKNIYLFRDTLASIEANLEE